MMDNPLFYKSSKKGRFFRVLFVACCVFVVVLLVTAFIYLAACHQNISRQLAQGIPVRGNELAIANLYFTSCVPYFVLASAMVFCAFMIRKMAACTDSVPEKLTPCMFNPAIEAGGSVFIEQAELEEDKDDDW